jgi:hypothetical protein
MAAGAAQTPVIKNGPAPVHARTCPKLAITPKPGESVLARPLSQLPPAEVYAAVYYLDGCPRRLIEARGKKTR